MHPHQLIHSTAPTEAKTESLGQYSTEVAFYREISMIRMNEVLEVLEDHVYTVD